MYYRYNQCFFLTFSANKKLGVYGLLWVCQLAATKIDTFFHQIAKSQAGFDGGCFFGI